MRARRRVGWAVAGALAARMAAAQTGPAAPPEGDASGWIDRGIALRTERRDEEALEQFRRAWGASRSPEAQAQMGLAEQALGRWVDAERDLSAAVAREHAWVTRHRAALDEALREVRAHLGTLTVRSQTPNAQVTVDGRDLGALASVGALRVEAGTVTVVVRATGFVTRRRVLDVQAGDDLLESFDLVADQPPEPSTTALRPASRAPLARSVGVGLLVGAGVLAVSAGALWAWRESGAQEFNAAGCLVDRTTGVAGPGPSCAGLEARTSTLTALTVAGVATAGLLGVGGVVLLLTSREPTRAAWCAPGWASVACAVRF